jgi:hypothetical protein
LAPVSAEALESALGLAASGEAAAGDAVVGGAAEGLTTPVDGEAVPAQPARAMTIAPMNAVDRSPWSSDVDMISSSWKRPT